MKKITKYLIILACLIPTTIIFAAPHSFEQDSITISNNAKKLLQNRKFIASKDRLIFQLSKGISSNSDKLKDLIQYHLARYYYTHQKLELALQIITINTQDSLTKNDAKFYNIRGAIYSLNKQYNKAIQSFIKAANAYQASGQTEKEFVIYNNIANIYIALGDYQQAYKYSALCFSKIRHYPKNQHYFSILGILAICETNLGMIDSARSHIQLGFQKIKKTTPILSSIILNYAKAELELKVRDFNEAILYATKSLTLSNKVHFTQYEVISSIILMKANLQLKDYAIALQYGLFADNKSAQISNLSIKHAITNGLSEAYFYLDDYKKAYHYMKMTDSLKTIDRNAKNKARMDKLLVEFESLKSKNKILKQDITIAEMDHSIEVQNKIIVTTVLSIVILCLLITAIIIYNKQRLKFIFQKQTIKISKAVIESEEKERMRISSELHDGLASELTALRLELEQNSSTSKKSYEMLKQAHQITRTISHNLSPLLLEQKGLVKAIKNVIDNNYSNVNIHFYSNITHKIGLEKDKKIVLFRSVQDLIQNAIKHAKATEVNVQILQNGKLISFNIEDDGIGMQQNQIENSLSLNALKRRIETIKGEIHIESSPNEGTSIFIKINHEDE